MKSFKVAHERNFDDFTKKARYHYQRKFTKDEKKMAMNAVVSSMIKEEKFSKVSSPYTSANTAPGGEFEKDPLPLQRKRLEDTRSTMRAAGIV